MIVGFKRGKICTIFARVNQLEVMQLEIGVDLGLTQDEIVLF